MSGAAFYLWVDEALAAIKATPATSDLLAWALGHPELSRAGLWCEFGVFQGASLRRIVAGRDRPVGEAPRVFGFDCFKGLPEEWRWNHLQVMPKGYFAVDALPEVLGAELVEGLFADTLPGFLTEHPEQAITLAHIDCDLYSSSRFVLHAIRPRLHPGAIIVFDELVGYPAFRDGELRALWEAMQEDALAFEWLAHQEKGPGVEWQQVAIRVVAARTKENE